MTRLCKSRSPKEQHWSACKRRGRERCGFEGGQEKGRGAVLRKAHLQGHGSLSFVAEALPMLHPSASLGKRQSPSLAWNEQRVLHRLCPSKGRSFAIWAGDPVCALGLEDPVVLVVGFSRPQRHGGKPLTRSGLKEDFLLCAVHGGLDTHSSASQIGERDGES